MNSLYLTLYTTTRIVVVSPLRARQFLIEESDGKTIYLEDWWSLTSSDNNEWPKKRPLKKALSERDVQLAAAMGLHDKWIEDPCGFFFSFFFALADVVSHRLKKGRRICGFGNMAFQYCSSYVSRSHPKKGLDGKFSWQICMMLTQIKHRHCRFILFVIIIIVMKDVQCIPSWIFQNMLCMCLE